MASALKCFSRIWGSRTLPLDLDIFFSSFSHQPWISSFLGRGSPAAIRNAGQYTAWYLRMSLAMMCRSAGQKVPEALALVQ